MTSNAAISAVAVDTYTATTPDGRVAIYYTTFVNVNDAVCFELNVLLLLTLLLDCPTQR